MIGKGLKEMNEIKYYNILEKEWESKKGIFTAREIYQQPSTWMKTVNQIKEMKSEIDHFLTPILDSEEATVIFMGAGTSEFVGRALASTLNSQVACSVQACGTTDMVVAPENYIMKGRKTVLVSFGRSGNSPESVGALETAEAVDNQVLHLFITCNKEGALAKKASTNKNCLSICLTDETHDQSFAMTSSFSNMYLAALLCFNLKQLDQVGTDVLHVSDRVQQFLDHEFNQISDFITAYDFNRIVYLGAEHLKGISQESALKMLELSAGRVVTMYDTPLGFRHGPKSIVDDSTLTVMYLSDEDYRRQYEIDLIKEMSQQRKGNKLMVVCNRECGELKELVDLSICMNYSTNTPLMLGLSAIVIAQLIALFKSDLLGITPDNPCPTGEVNRVVKGVILYPFNGE